MSAVIHDRQEAVDALYAQLFAAPAREAPNSQSNAHASPPLTDADVLSKALRARNGAKVQALVNGDTSAYGSHSEADAALIGFLSFYTDDPAQLDRLYRGTRLYREKWERSDYRERTIALGLQRAEHWTPSGTGTTFRTGDRAEPAAVDDQVNDVPASPDYHHTDAGNAELFAARNRDGLRFNHRTGAWFLWQGHRWAPDTTGAVRQRAKAIPRERLRAAAELEDKDERKRAAAWALASESRVRLDALLSLAESEPPLADAGDDWDADPWLLGVANGVINLRTGELRPGRQSDRITLASPVVYDPAATAPRWGRFLAEVFRDDDDLIDWVHRFVGYSITGDTREQVLAIAFGAGANGKSTFFRALAAALGPYCYNMPFSTLELNARTSVPNDLAALVGRRLVTASETNEGARLNEARIKALTGGDLITARFLHREFFEFVPVAKFWLATNHKPRVADDSYGFWRRVRLLPFLAQFKGQAADPRLDEALREEAPGILVWAVRGCLAWQDRGLGDTPAAVATATKAYRDESDPLAAFLADRCVLDPEATIAASALYKAYKEWCDEQGMREREILSSTAFGRRMGERFVKEHRKAGWEYHGLRRRTPSDPPDGEPAPGDGLGCHNSPPTSPESADSAPGDGFGHTNPSPDFTSHSAENWREAADPLAENDVFLRNTSSWGEHGLTRQTRHPSPNPSPDAPDGDDMACLFYADEYAAPVGWVKCPACMKPFDGAGEATYCPTCLGED